MNKRLKMLCITAMGIALYVALSVTIKIPIVGHIALDLGYIVLGVYCYLFGGAAGAVVGGAGCVFVSLLTSGWFPPGWLLGNLFIGAVCGKGYVREDNRRAHRMNYCLTYAAVFVGIAVIKPVVECILYQLPLWAKVSTSSIGAIMDALVMFVGLAIAPRLSRLTKGMSR